MNGKARSAYLLLAALGLVISGLTQTPEPERDAVLARMQEQWGPPHIDDSAIVFKNASYQLQPLFNERGALVAIKGSALGNSVMKSRTYQRLIQQLEAVKTSGELRKTDSRWSWGMNTMTKRIDRYEHAVTDRCESGPGKSRGVGWFQVLYPHPVTGEITSIEKPHSEVQTPCPGFDGKEMTCVQLETPDWTLTEFSIGEDNFLVGSEEFPELKEGARVTLNAFGPLDRVCGSL